MLKCSSCDGALAPGKLLSQHPIHFEAAEGHVPFFTLSVQAGQVKVQALMCQKCGRIELRGDVEKLRSILK